MPTIPIGRPSSAPCRSRSAPERPRTRGWRSPAARVRGPFPEVVRARQHAVLGDDEVGLDRVGAHRERTCVRLDRLLGVVRRGAAVRDHERRPGVERGQCGRAAVVPSAAGDDERGSEHRGKDRTQERTENGNRIGHRALLEDEAPNLGSRDDVAMTRLACVRARITRPARSGETAERRQCERRVVARDRREIGDETNTSAAA